LERACARQPWRIVEIQSCVLPFSKLEGQKIDLKALSQEKSAVKKLDNIRNDHQKRISELQKSQDLDMLKAGLVELNLELVDNAILIVNSAIANQIDWSEINNIVKEAQAQGDQVACAIAALKLETNHITMNLGDPYDISDSDSDLDEEGDQKSRKKKKKKKGPQFTKVNINLSLSAYGNARSFYDKKRFSSKKEQKTIDASEKALKSAERKTKETLKEVETTTRIKKARKTYWFEKFLWFISSENFLVIGGRDQQQNELVVKRYLEPGDLYVHADLHGATSVIIKNPSGQPVPPKTLNEAGCMAVCYSAAWEARIVTSAWWVHHQQVSKTAPSGEYLTTGSFMIRGKKNFLPPCYLVMGFGFLFKLDESCVENHVNERRVRTVEEIEPIAAETEIEEELTIQDESGDENETKTTPNETAEQEEDEEEEESLFPDTSIDLQLTKEGKVQLQRGTNKPPDGEEGKGASLDGNNQSSGKQRLSAKQRRDNKKKSKQSKEGLSQENEGNDKFEGENNDEEIRKKSSKSTEQQRQHQQQQQQQQQQLKRGKKAKLKKIKEKYGEQDEEERQMMMEILASAGPAKESKADKRKKEKKGSKSNRPVSGRPAYKDARPNIAHVDENFQVKQNANNIEAESGGQSKEENLTNKVNEINLRENGPIGNNGEKTSDSAEKDSETSEIVAEKSSDCNHEKDLTNNEEHVNAAEPPGEEESSTTIEKENIVISDDEEDLTPKESVSLLDSLTGCPLTDDLLLFAVPVCAPYTAVQGYKYKVKLTPGTALRGKAAKTALNTFLFSKEASHLEKDLMKTLKDNDLSRYIPGKVKVSAPNLQKIKKK
ncbi:PREDICTED: nuclear export mediator factor NEMF-like, partial [Acropora digitifera]|uniref:nuclear export mediator factor NEMF-like n=1 Tax=Acropora digitifera TaxID=70779 RepID=UPI00077AF041